jgi:hypothetical protein
MLQVVVKVRIGKRQGNSASLPTIIRRQPGRHLIGEATQTVSGGRHSEDMALTNLGLALNGLSQRPPSSGTRPQSTGRPGDGYREDIALNNGEMRQTGQWTRDRTVYPGRS